MTAGEAALLLAAAAAGGALNSVVGGGTFIAFPALLFAGVPPVSANATTTLALWPASVASALAYRNDVRLGRPLLVALAVASLAGGALGALLLLWTPSATFVRLVPWLLLFATALFTAGGPLASRFGAREEASGSGPAVVALTVSQLAISVYGGYFGGGMGILMLATWTVLGMTDIHSMNGLRTLLGAILNGVALLAFVAAGAIAWGPGLVMVSGAAAGGWFGATLARRVDRRWVRAFVTAVAWAMTATFFVREP